MNYQIVKNEQALLDFIEWLPDLEQNETYYLSLFARKKYSPNLIKSNDKTQLKRFTSNKERMFDKIKQLEIEVGRWKLREMSAPQESLVLYIMPNPRCIHKATRAMGKKCWDLDRSQNFNLVAEAMSCVQRSKSRACFVDFDIDNKDIDLTKLYNIFPECPMTNPPFDILETRGGYHVLVRPQHATNWIKGHNETCQGFPELKVLENWHGEITKTFPVDQSADQLTPVPGCTQGGFVPKFITI